MSANPYWRKIEETYGIGLSRREGDLLRYLIHRADFKTGRCYPGFRRILKDMGMNIRTFLAARLALHSLGHLTWTQRRTIGRQNDTTEYQLAPWWWVLPYTQGVGVKGHRKHTTAKPDDSFAQDKRPMCRSCKSRLGDGESCIVCFKHRESQRGVADVLPSSQPIA